MRKDIKASLSNQVSEREKKNRELARRIATEGIVLLKNESILPLDKKSVKIALYGNGARRTIYGGTGSGEVNARERISIEQGLINAGATITTLNWLNRYENQWIEGKQAYIRNGKKKLRKISSGILAELIASEYEYPFGDEITEKDIQESDTNICIYVIARQSGEGKDRTLTEGSYYLTQLELTNIRKCAKAYEKCIVLINTGASIDVGKLQNEKSVGAILYMAQLGMESGNAVADILFGNETPSGRLAVTWVKEYDDISASEEFGTMSKDINRVQYNEGIYVGYRYFHTKQIEVQYPFGYGLSYTQFDVKCEEISFAKEEIYCSIVVKNIGAIFSGKESFGLYVEGPNTEIERPKKQLIALGKTGELKPKNSEKIELCIPMNRCSVFSEKRNITLVEAGKYKIYLGANVEEAKSVGSFTVEHDIICTEHGIDKKTNNEKKYYTKKTKELLEVLSAKDLVELCVGNGLRLDSRGNVVPGSVGSTSTKFIKKGIANMVMCDGPAGVRLSCRSTIDKRGKIKPVDYPLSLYELLPDFISKTQIGNPKKNTVIYQFVTGFPVATAVAQTWNLNLSYQMGKAVGSEMEEYGVDCWLAPALNIIRNPLCGRNYEYYSEDPVVSGLMASAITKGVQEVPGKYVTIKHFACNNQETNRYYMSSDLSERSLREIYLKGFEIVVKEAKPRLIMTAYNKVNGTYSAENRMLLEEVLRNEWGFEGLVMTDWLSVGENRANEALSISAGVDLIMPGNKKNKKLLYKAYKDEKIGIEDLHRAAGNVLSIIFKEL